jgi:hypothetical protein
MSAVAIQPEPERTALETARPPMRVVAGGGKLYTGGVPGNKGGYGKPSEFARACREAFTDAQLIRVAVRIAIGDVLEQIDTAKNGEPIYGATKNSDRLRAIEWLSNRGWGLAKQSLEVSGAITTGPITEAERRARIRAILLQALERIPEAEVVSG